MAPDRKAQLSGEETLKDLSPHAPRTPVLVIGVGGTGKQALVGLTQAMDATGLGYDQPSPRTNRFISAIFMDGDLNETDQRSERENPESNHLRRAGVHMVPLNVPNFDGVLKRVGLNAKLTPDFPSATDIEGCKGDGRVGVTRYSLLRSGEIGDSVVNPVKAMTEVVRSWKAVSSGIDMGPQVQLVVVMGMHGGTGPAGLAIAADAVSVMKSLLPGKDISTNIVMMSGESAQISSSMGSDGNERKRDYNSLVTGMRANDMTQRGGVELPDGTFIEGVPQWITIINAQSDERSVDTNEDGHYQPAKQAAKALIAGVTGRHTGSARSNIEVEIPQPDRDASGRSLKRFSWVGAAEAQPKPSRQAMALIKKRSFFYGATGLGEPKQDAVNGELPQLGFEAAINEILEDGDIPTLSRAELEPDQAANNVGNAVSTLELHIVQLKADIRRKTTTKWNKTITDLFTKAEGLLSRYGISTALKYAEDCRVGAENLLKAIKAELEAQRSTVDSYRSIVDKKRGTIQSLGTPSVIPIKRGMDERRIRSAVEELSSVAQRYIAEVARLEILERLNVAIEKGMLVNARTLKENMDTIWENATSVYESISAEPIGYTTPFDIPVDVDMNFTGNPVDLRTQMGEWSFDEMETVARGIGLEASDYDLVEKLRGRIDVMEALVRRSAPLKRTMPGRNDKHLRKVREVTVPVGSSEKLRINVDGEIVSNGSEGSQVTPDKFRAWATTVDGGYVVSQEVHGGELLEDPYFFECMREFLKLSRSERMKFFLTEGEHDRLLLPFAHRLAEMQQEEQGGKGEITRDGEGLSRYKRN